ncbi:hypothetical protein SAMN05446935_7094 [Burkholderia sp. YR290]|jgi:hypothetical protein|uniref:hypothetical protein n=1 Tax=Paraburkholderia hospita TaxID=169430 RepID=UPI0009A8A88F|nr:hypothetical protein [Paraburkholderia hospita]SKC91219.1 hypothetical protein SAMN05446934_5751 [Paraburkholderia hospita]SKC92171.1 hypothetical protein SAMN05445504_6468 [Burkholderia sp. CF099]SOE86583.1 hypothetical protein SAMN05446935_7094 [Burkholderia sp. YR290]
MSRAQTSELVKRAYAAGDADAAVALLDQSIALGHRRIALIRYLQAQYLEAALDARHHEYVRGIAARMSPDTLARVVGEARVRRGRQSADEHDECPG